MAKKKSPDHPPQHYLDVAKRHLEKVQAAWDEPTDWSDLTTYGLYCLEALIHAAAVAAKLRTVKTHWGKVDIAGELHRKHGLTDVSTLMSDLNEGRKAKAYGDQEFDESEFDAEDIANNIEAFFEEVNLFVQSKRLRQK